MSVIRNSAITAVFHFPHEKVKSNVLINAILKLIAFAFARSIWCCLFELCMRTNTYAHIYINTLIYLTSLFVYTGLSDKFVYEAVGSNFLIMLMLLPMLGNFSLLYYVRAYYFRFSFLLLESDHGLLLHNKNCICVGERYLG